MRLFYNSDGHSVVPYASYEISGRREQRLPYSSVPLCGIVPICTSRSIHFFYHALLYFQRLTSVDGIQLGPIAVWQREKPAGHQGMCSLSPLLPRPRMGNDSFLSQGLQFLLDAPHLYLYALLGFQCLTPLASSDLAAICALLSLGSFTILISILQFSHIFPSLNLFNYPFLHVTFASCQEID